jgi:hypothetical protein
MKTLLPALFAVASLTGCATSEIQSSEIDITSIFVDDTLLNKETDGTTQSYNYSTNTPFKELKIAMMDLLGDEWRELQTSEPQKEHRVVFINPKQPSTQIWLSQDEHEFAEDRFVVSLTLLTKLPALNFGSQ